MRSGPATRTACSAIRSFALFHAQGMGECNACACSAEQSSTHSAGRHLRSSASQISLQHCGDRRPVLPFVEDSLRRPQRPGNQRAEAHSGGTLPAIHPRELPGTASSAAMLWQGHRTSCLNVRHSALRPALHQEKSRDSLCRSCGCQRFLVESTGKAGCNSCSGHM
jgi:hypothetical protein